MAITRRDTFRFLYEDNDGELYELEFDYDGNGTSIKHGGTLKSLAGKDTARVTVTVDTASLAAWRAYHPSRKVRAAVYNTSQALETILNV